MARFQAQTTPQLDHMLDYLSEKLGFPSNKKAELLREIATLSYWLVYQAEHGYIIQAQKGDETQRLDHPLLHQLARNVPQGEEHVTVLLSDEEVQRLSEVLERDIELTPALEGILQRIARKERTPPTIRWTEHD